ncbi:PilZ domain-containing protein [Pseudomonas abieticivorans]|uniref:PilZ domain-containing protein n=1 Tax=Pseudomonas abieticivorans TaxID=2931382 RepID=UPI0020BFEBC8|nr:PilZ domain-containing protein [Pseudomonas sp. PIA16]
MSQTDRDYSEKRNFIRMTVNANVKLRLGEHTFDAICRDLSSSGMQIEVEARSAFKAGERISVHMPSDHPALKDLNADAEVVRVKDLGGGVQSLGLSILHMN